MPRMSTHGTGRQAERPGSLKVSTELCRIRHDRLMQHLSFGASKQPGPAGRCFRAPRRTDLTRVVDDWKNSPWAVLGCGSLSQ